MLDGEMIFAATRTGARCADGASPRSASARIGVPLGAKRSSSALRRSVVVLGRLVFDRNQRGGVARRLEGLGDNEGDRLAAEWILAS